MIRLTTKPMRRGALIVASLIALSGFVVVLQGSPAGAVTTTFTSAEIGTTGDTPSFTESGPWTMTWNYSCTGPANDDGLLVVINAPQGDTAGDVGPLEVDASASGEDYYYDTGSFNLAVTSDCTWSITVASGPDTSASLPATFTSGQTGTSGNTQQFDTSAAWTMAWNYTCTNADPGDDVFDVFVNQPANDTTDDAGPNETNTNGSGTDSYTDTGTFTLSIVSDCAWSIAVSAGSSSPPPTTTTTTSTPSPTTTTTSPPPTTSGGGYDLVGTDGGVFVFGNPNGFYGSLPQLKISVNDIRGMVPTATGKGYFLVGADGGVFSFGDAPFENSLPGLKVHVNNIVGIVPTHDDQGYFLVGADGGVFSFGDAPFENSLPGENIHVNNIVGIASTSDDNGYWVVSSTGTVYPFGDAAAFGNATPSSGTHMVGIAATKDSGGYWLLGNNGAIYPFGDANSYGSLTSNGVSSSSAVALVPTLMGAGYWIVTAAGGVYPYGDAPNDNSLPGLGVKVTNIVGGVPTI
jgi:hypothetical protein